MSGRHPASDPGFPPQRARATSAPAARRIATPLLRRRPGAGVPHRSDVSREEINGFELYLVDGTAVALERGESGFERVVAELREQGRWRTKRRVSEACGPEPDVLSRLITGEERRYRAP